MQNSDLCDQSAIAEAKRLLLTISAQRRVQNQWFGIEECANIEFEENSGWCMGMLALFRYARGEAVPPFIVQDFIDELLKLMFCGLATNTMALPPFKRMQDKPWAIAWRLAELRLAMEGEIEMDVSQIAHLLGESASTIEHQLCEKGFSPEEAVPKAFLDEIFQALSTVKGPELGLEKKRI